MKIYFREADKAKNIEELIKKGFKSSIFIQTYKDPEFKVQQCYGARRSFLDLYWICKTYFPKTTKGEVAKAIFKLHKEIGFNASYCCYIKKIVFFKSGTTYTELYCYRGEQKGVGRYSFNDIKKLAHA